jgi:hypothetical protein
MAYCLVMDARWRQRRSRKLMPSDAVRVPRWLLDALLLSLRSSMETPTSRARIRQFRIDALRFMAVENLRETRAALGPTRWGRGKRDASAKPRMLNSRVPAAGTLFERAEASLSGEPAAGTAKAIADSWRRVRRYLEAHKGRPGPYRIPHFIRFRRS